MIYQKASNLFNAAVYIRLSREDGDKEESDSVGNQRKLLTEYVNKHDDFILYDVYIDDGFTGTNFDRPDFHRMIADIENNKVNCVVVPRSTDRKAKDCWTTQKRESSIPSS